MEKQAFVNLANELRPYLEPGVGGPRDDVLTVEKQLAMTVSFLKDQGSLSMTANAFGVAICTVPVVVRKVCQVLTKHLGPIYIKLPSSEQMKQEIRQMENKYGFPQAFGCVDGTHIPITQPSENSHYYFSYKMKYTLNVQAVCNWRGLFLNVDACWPGSVHDGRVFANSKIAASLENIKCQWFTKKFLLVMTRSLPYF